MEIIFVNDASTDGTLQKLTTYEQAYPESVLVIHFEENCKQGAARNVALRGYFFSHLVFTYANSVCSINDILYHYCDNPSGTMGKIHETFQPDKMIVSVEYLSECLDRNIFASRKDEVEWMFLKNYYIYMLWEVFHRFADKAYEIYSETRRNVLEWIPDYKTNPYRFLPGNEFENLMLKLLDMDLNREKLEKVRLDMISKIKVPV